MVRGFVLVAFAATLGYAPAAPVPKDAPKPWRFPTQVGTEWVYDCTGGKRDSVVTETVTKVEERDGAKAIHIRYTCEESEQQVTDARVLWLDNNGLFDTLGRLNPKPEFFLLKLPYAIGDVWERKHTDVWYDRTTGRVVAEERI